LPPIAATVFLFRTAFHAGKKGDMFWAKSHRSSVFAIFSGWTFLCCAASASTQPTPLLQYEFNTAGSVQTSTGSDPLALTTSNGSVATDFVTSSATGPSGNPGDLSLDLATLTAPSNYAATTSSADNPMLDNLKAFTVTAWIGNLTATNRAEYVFDLGTGGTSIAFALNGSSSADAETVKIGGGSTVTASFPLSSVSSTWKFIAATFDSSGNIDFYEGSTVAGSALVTDGATQLSDTRDSIGSPNSFAGIGNTNPGSSNQLAGDLDNVRLYGSALTASGIDLVRDQDLPETGCSPAVAVCLLLMARWRPRRRPTLRIEFISDGA
jgi:hypothetical protein